MCAFYFFWLSASHDLRLGMDGILLALCDHGFERSGQCVVNNNNNLGPPPIFCENVENVESELNIPGKGDVIALEFTTYVCYKHMCATNYNRRKTPDNMHKVC